MGEVIDNQYNGQTPSRANASFWNGEINWLSSGELNRGVVSETIEKITEDGRKNANLKIVPKGTFVMAITGLEAAGTRGNCAKLGIDTTMNQSCMALFPKKKLLDSSFLFQWYRKVGEEYGLQYTQGTKQQSYNAELLKILPIVLPSVSEQVLIADFFDKIDDTIDLHQRKVTLLKRLKEAYLTRMLPQNSENIPLLRFADYFDPWEQRKFEDLAESFNYGLNASAMEFDGENKYIRITDIDEYSHRFIQSGLTSPNTDLSNANDYLLKEGDILFARTGASVGKSYQYDPLDGKVYYAGFLIRARIKPEFDSSFIFQNTLTEKYNNFIKITSQRSGQPGVNAQEYANFSIMVPSIGEQVKLGNFFKQLDNAIALHQCKIEKLAEAKKVLLAAMFV